MAHERAERVCTAVGAYTPRGPPLEASLRALSQSPLLRYVAFTALYLAQGLPWGFISVGYVVFLADQGLDNTAVGTALGLAYVPWSFKIVAGPVLDRLPRSRWGRRRPFIVGAELLMGITLLMLLLLDPVADLGAIGIVLFLHNSAAAVQDVAVDALAVDVLPEDQRGRANSLMWAGKSAGVALGGGGGTVLAKYFGWPALFVILALLIWAVMAIPILVREYPEGEAPAARGRFDWATVKQTFGFVTPWAGLGVAMVTPVGYAMVGAVFVRMLRADLGLGEEAIGLVSGIVEPIAGVVGALIGGVLADRIGMRKAMGGAMVVIGLCMAVWGLSPGYWPHLWFIVGYVAVLNLSIYAYNAASLGFFMTMSNPAVGATQFAMYMAATNLTYAWTSPTGGWVADTWGYPALFLGGAAVQVLTIGVLPFVDPHRAEAVYREHGLAAEAADAEATG